MSARKSRRVASSHCTSVLRRLLTKPFMWLNGRRSSCAVAARSSSRTRSGADTNSGASALIVGEAASPHEAIDVTVRTGNLFRLQMWLCEYRTDEGRHVASPKGGPSGWNCWKLTEADPANGCAVASVRSRAEFFEDVRNVLLHHVQRH